MSILNSSAKDFQLAARQVVRRLVQAVKESFSKVSVQSQQEWYYARYAMQTGTYPIKTLGNGIPLPQINDSSPAPCDRQMVEFLRRNLDAQNPEPYVKLGQHNDYLEPLKAARQLAHEIGVRKIAVLLPVFLLETCPPTNFLGLRIKCNDTDENLKKKRDQYLKTLQKKYKKFRQSPEGQRREMIRENTVSPMPLRIYETGLYRKMCNAGDTPKLAG